MIEEYLKYWNEVEGQKPCNDPEFIKLFIEFVDGKDSENFEFTGDNDYCGNTAIVYDISPRYSFTRSTAFEFAYGTDFVKVFTAYHEGYWVPEYISLKGSEAKVILGMLRDKFMNWGGFAL